MWKQLIYVDKCTKLITNNPGTAMYETRPWSVTLPLLRVTRPRVFSVVLQEDNNV